MYPLRLPASDLKLAASDSLPVELVCVFLLAVVSGRILLGGGAAGECATHFHLCSIQHKAVPG